MEEKRFLTSSRMIVFLIFFITFSNLIAAQDECQPTSCNSSGPIIRFPFRLTGRQPEHCGYPGFTLSCNSDNGTEFEFQFPVRASIRNIVLPVSARATVQEIDYGAQVIRLSVLNGSCLPARVPAVNSTPSPFEMYYPYSWLSGGYTLFNCSGKPNDGRSSGPITCLGNGVYQIYPYPSYYSFSDLSVSNCAKMYNISDISEVLFNGPSQYSVDDTQLHWPEPVCGDCERRGMYCRLRSNGTNNETECFGSERPGDPQQGKKVITIVMIGVFLMALVLGAMYSLYIVKKRKQENQIRTQKFLEDYKALRPARYTYAEIKRITQGFNHRLGQDCYSTLCKGKLSNNVLVAVEVLKNVIWNDENEFIDQVRTIGEVHHANVARLVGYCTDGNRRALVYEFLQNDSLEKYISSGKNNNSNEENTLGWEKLHEIAIGIAKGLDCLHQRILHFDIRPHNIWLDRNLDPKIAGFGLAKLCSEKKSVDGIMTAARGTIGYIAPEVLSKDFGDVSYKSDIFSFGILLLDMVRGRKNFRSGGEDGSEVYFPEWMYNQLDKGEDIAIQIEKEDETEIVKRLIIVGLWCIQWYPSDRPSTKVMIQMLESEKMPVMPPNPFAALISGNAIASSSSN